MQWLRDGLGIIDDAAETSTLAAAADPAQAVYLVPAFVGLGAPHWDADARAALDDMTARAGIDYWTAGLRQIVALAAEHGGEAKPSGAGGGDSAVALFTDPETRSSFVTACGAAGLRVIPTHLAAGAHASKE